MSSLQSSKTSRKQNLYEETINRMLAAIRDGVFQPGERLPGERELAQLMGVNRSTLREALRGLELMRVIEKRTGEGIFVLEGRHTASIETLVFQFLSEDGLDLDAVISSFEAVTCLEATMAKLAAQRVTAEALEQLDDILWKMERALQEGEEFAELDRRFNLFLGEACQSPVLLQLTTTIWIIIKRYVDLLYQDFAHRMRGLRNHKQTLAAVRARDGERAYRCMENHFQWGGATLLSRLKEPSS